MTLECTSAQSDPTPEEKKTGITQTTLKNDDESVEMIQDVEHPSSVLCKDPHHQANI